MSCHDEDEKKSFSVFGITGWDLFWYTVVTIVAIYLYPRMGVWIGG